jgi:putative molybdopterin biosynthesis protein
MRDLMSTKEVADYLRLKERKIYDLVSKDLIPTTRVSGKLLFARERIDAWVRGNTVSSLPVQASRPPHVVVGSHDPLLDWAIRESRCGLASMCYGSLDGIDRMVAGQASVAAIHLPPGQGSRRNIGICQERLERHDMVLLAWAQREQGLILAPGNPLHIHTLNDLVTTQARVIARQTQAGSYLLFQELLARAQITSQALNWAREIANTESDVAAAVLEGSADAGLAVRSVAKQFQLDFLPLARESLDLIVSRPAYFEAPLQSLLHFTASRPFQDYAIKLSGYHLAELGQVLWNA